jgi:hypothetical protein
MPTDLDIYRSAAILIEHHRERAVIEAGRLQDAMLAKGDMDGVSVWRAIGRAIRELQQSVRPPDMPLH